MAAPAGVAVAPRRAALAVAAAPARAAARARLREARRGRRAATRCARTEPEEGAPAPAPAAASTSPAPAADASRRPVSQGNVAARYLYDGACPVCRALRDALARRPGGEQITFVDISKKGYDAAANSGVSFERAMETIHVIVPCSTAEFSEEKADFSDDDEDVVLTGLDALEKLFELVGWGWLFKLARLPVLSAAAALLYKAVSSNRQALGRYASGPAAEALLALGRASAEVLGVQVECDDETGCRDSLDAAIEAVAAQGDVALEEALARRPALLGCYIQPSRGVMRAGVVDVATGELRAVGKRYGEDGTVADTFLLDQPLEDATSLKQIGDALKVLVARAKWQGDVGVALPGLLVPSSSDGRAADRRKGPSLDQAQGVAPAAAKLGRAEAEGVLSERCGREVCVLTNVEAHGYATIAAIEAEATVPKSDSDGETTASSSDGADSSAVPSSSSGLVCYVAAASDDLYLALFKDGAVVRNADLRDAELWRWPEGGAAAPLPSPKEDASSPLWDAWAERLARQLARVESTLRTRGKRVSAFCVAGSAADAFQLWSERANLCADGPRAPVTRAFVAEIDGTAETQGVRGAALGGAFLHRFREDVASVRAAVGRATAVSPELVSRKELRNLFDEFSRGKGVISLDAFARLVGALGVTLPEDELRELLLDVDSDNNEVVSFEEFERWWLYAVGGPAVTVVHSPRTLEQVIDEEAVAGGRVVVIMVGITSCAPCKRFVPRFDTIGAANRAEARFLRLYANENASLVRLAKDTLKLSATPSFFFYKGGELVHRHSGANSLKFTDALEEQLGKLPAGSWESKWGGTKKDGGAREPRAAAPRLTKAKREEMEDKVAQP